MEWTARLAPAATLVGVAAGYFVAGKLGLSLASVHASASPVWPPTGIALAAFLLLGRRVWPAVFVGAFLVNATTAGNLATSIGIASGNTLEGIVGAFLVTRLANGRGAFERALDVFRFMVLAGFVSTMISATFGATSLWLAGFAQGSDFGPIWLTWWLGDAAGAVVVAPAVLLWLANPRLTWVPAQSSEAAVLGATIALVGSIVFGGFLLPPGRGYELSFLCLPPAIWAAFRFGPRGTATAVLFLSAIAIWGTLRGSGPFPGHSENESLLLLQGFMIVLSVTASSLTAMVSQYRRTLGELESKTIELARSNAELEQFAHVVSHDLKAPLRGISSLASWIAEDCKDVLPDESRERLRLVEERAKRMGRLIDGVLAYSRVGRARSVSERVDPRLVLEEVIDSLEPPDHVSVRIEGAFPVIWHDRTQLTQVFQNLIGNALQHLGKPRGTVVVSCRERPGELEFCVRDDGAGIHERHLERIFRMFQILDPDKETTGIGLSIVKKIVEMHGGSISVESTVGAGTTFRFTVPKPATRRHAARSGSTPSRTVERA